MVSLIAIGLAALNFYGILVNQIKLIYVAYFSSLALKFACLLAWAWTLNQLYRNVKSAQKLLPDKRVFILQASFLAAYLTFYIGMDVFAY